MAEQVNGVDRILGQLGQVQSSLSAVSDVLRSQTMMLKKIVDAATQPVDRTSPVAEALLTLANATTANTTAIREFEASMITLPQRLQVMFKNEVERAMTMI